MSTMEVIESKRSHVDLDRIISNQFKVLDDLKDGDHARIR